MNQKINKRALWGLAVAFIFLSGILVMLGCVGQEEQPETTTTEETKTTTAELKLTVVYDNNPYDSRLEPSWGFACLVEMEDITLLFDTGANPGILLSNMAKLKVDLSQIQIIVLSHKHFDHTWGLSGILEENNHVKVYVPASGMVELKKSVRNYGVELIEVTRDPMPICEGVETTGELGSSSLPEQSLLVSTSVGLVVITGCAHPGTVKIVSTAKEHTNQEIYLVLGGFHLKDASKYKLSKVIQGFKDLGVQNVGPSHCSGDRTRQMFHTEFGNRYIEVGVGTTITIVADLTSEPKSEAGIVCRVQNPPLPPPRQV